MVGIMNAGKQFEKDLRLNDTACGKYEEIDK
jgi:hypothetical protein